MSNHKQTTVLLEDGTTGIVDTENLDIYEYIGTFVTVKLHDENGNIIYKRGTLKEVLV